MTWLTSSAPWCFNFELFAPFFLGDWGAYLYHVILIKVAHIVSTQKANGAARFIAARFIARHIEVETPQIYSSTCQRPTQENFLHRLESGGWVWDGRWQALKFGGVKV